MRGGLAWRYAYMKINRCWAAWIKVCTSLYINKSSYVDMSISRSRRPTINKCSYDEVWIWGRVGIIICLNAHLFIWTSKDMFICRRVDGYRREPDVYSYTHISACLLVHMHIFLYVDLCMRVRSNQAILICVYLHEVRLGSTYA